MKAIGYVRVSTEGQAMDGVSLDAQRARIEAWALAHGAELLGVLADEGVSGKRAANRPGLMAALAAAKKERAALVVYSLSRFSRSVLDTIVLAKELERAGADLVSLTEDVNTTTPTGRAFFRILAVLYELERDITAERTREALAHLRKTGRRFSRFAPYGFDLAEDGETLTTNPREQEAIAKARCLRAAGRSLREIARELEAAGYTPKNGGAWSAEAVKRALKHSEAA